MARYYAVSGTDAQCVTQDVREAVSAAERAPWADGRVWLHFEEPMGYAEIGGYLVFDTDRHDHHE